MLIDAQVQRDIQRRSVFDRFRFGVLGLFRCYFGSDLRMSGTAECPVVLAPRHVPASLFFRYSRRSAPRVFQALTPEKSSGSTMTVITNSALVE
ncbi:hypothetical protein IL38_03335 [Actinopolyspora erythraea]|uniref:Uncharacterized protein n=1 Tax=Actinopolyspora erythraea TaxID=414996 RepID=A0ABR4X8S3_9ACTN|nr:hypothetical protein IL38_03335 [Actinopolyspora erythraea]